MRARWASLAAVVATTAAVVLVVALVTVGLGRGSGELPRLRLANGAADSAATMTAPAVGKRAAGGSSFELTGTLPDGPSEARIHPLPTGSGDAGAVRRVARALGIDGEPRRTSTGWQLGALSVGETAGRPWSFGSGCGPDTPVASDGATVSCSIGSGSSGSGSSGGGSGDSGSGSASPGSVAVAEPAPALSPCPDNARCAKPGWAAPPPDAPSPVPTIDPAVARATADRVLAALGLADADVSVEPAGEHAFVHADPVVDGLPTWGYATQLEIDSSGQLVTASGYLGEPTRGRAYPIVSAQTALDSLPEPPRMMALCPANARCPAPQPAKVTGARLGLQLTQLADDEAALLPAWLFAVQDWPMPLAAPALEPQYLTAPSAKPVPAEPAPDQPAPDQPARGAFGFDAAYPTDQPAEVIVQYGDSGSCPHTGVTHLVKESADSVVVTLEGDAQPPDQVCTADYRQMLVTVKLGAALGQRTVIDGSRGSEVTVDRSCHHPMAQPPPPKDCRP